MAIQKIWQPFGRIVRYATRRTEESHKWQKNLKCGYCGECLHSFIHFCKAKNRKCYSCGQYGHYASLCKTARTYNQRSAPKLHRANITDRHCEICPERDYIASLMPFQGVETIELEKHSYNSSMNLQKNCVKQFEFENVKLLEQIKKLQDENKDLQEENKKLMGTVGRLQETQKQPNKPKDDEQKGQLKFSDMDASMKLLQQALKAAKAEISTINTDIMKSFIWNTYFKDQKTIRLLLDNPFECDSCGSEMLHYNCSCPAIVHMCNLCNEEGHYSLFCSKLQSELTK